MRLNGTVVSKALASFVGLASLFGAPAYAQPIQDAALYTAPAGVPSTLGGPTPRGEVTVFRERSFETTAPVMTGSGATLDPLDTDRDGLFSQAILVRSGPVVSNARDPETAGAIVFPASVTVIALVIQLDQIVATDAAWGLAPAVDYTADTRGYETRGPDFARIVPRADGTTAVEFSTNFITDTYTDEFRVLIDHGTAWVPNLAATVEITTGDDINIGATDGGRTGSPTGYTGLVPLALGCGDGVLDAAEACDGGGCCDASCALVLAGEVCRSSTGTCDPEEVCTGLEAACPEDSFVEDGASCADGVTCNGEELCGSGACLAGEAPVCDDLDACTTDMCAEPDGCTAVPIEGCCQADADCDDGDECTVDRCDLPTSSCSSDRIAGCGLDAGGAGDDAGAAVEGDSGAATDSGGGGLDGGGGSGLRADAGTDVVIVGCGCHTLASPGEQDVWWLALALAGALARRRRS